jgi:hypothetical protein
MPAPGAIAASASSTAAVRVRNDPATNRWMAVSTLAHCVPLPIPPTTLAAHATAIVGATAVPR